MRVVAVVLSRITEEDKDVKFLPVNGKTILEHVVHSLKNVRSISDVIIAAPDDQFSEYQKRVAADHGCGLYLGCNDDVTGRIKNAVSKKGGDVVLRFNAEMPFFSFNRHLVKKLVESHITKKADYSRYDGLPQGLSPDAVSAGALAAAHNGGVPYYRRPAPGSGRFNVNRLDEPFNLGHLSLGISKYADIEIFKNMAGLCGTNGSTENLGIFFTHLRQTLKQLLQNESGLENIKYLNQKLNGLERGLLCERLASMPIRAEIDLHNGCNLSCTTCSQSRSPLDKKSFDKELEMKDLLTGIFSIRDDGAYRIEPHPMTPETYNLIAKELFPYLLTCGFGMAGEPLLNRNTLDFLETARKYLVETEIVTNGILLGERYMQKFVSGLLNRLYVSFDGATKIVFEEIRRGAVFGEVLKNLKILRRIKEKNKCKTPSVAFGINVNSKNIGELPAMVKLAADYNVDTVNVTYTYFFKFMDERNALYHHPELVRDRFAEAKEAADRINVQLILPRAGGDGQRSACASLWEDVYFYSRGQVKPCCFIKAKENIASGNFRKIWNSKRQIEFRRSFKTPNDRLKNCLSCQRGEFSGIENKGNFFMTEQNFPH